ncbi:hypothetical protein WA026_014741 [Henosepilachna vigintioctopunctata]|uniref:Uncharacterized protein n=1 Tax=Henosepilachna vigintioctopunctata TaxID=420089 RepID=A0AAW1V9X1_9CUCU
MLIGWNCDTARPLQMEMTFDCLFTRHRSQTGIVGNCHSQKRRMAPSEPTPEMGGPWRRTTTGNGARFRVDRSEKVETKRRHEKCMEQLEN